MTQSDPTLPALHQFIGGAWFEGHSDASLEIVNPATEASIGRLKFATRGDIDLALQAASTSFGPWRDLAPAHRTNILVEAARLVRQSARELGYLTTLELGLRLSDAISLVERSADILE